MVIATSACFACNRIQSIIRTASWTRAGIKADWGFNQVYTTLSGILSENHWKIMAKIVQKTIEQATLECHQVYKLRMQKKKNKTIRPFKVASLREERLPVINLIMNLIYINIIITSIKQKSINVSATITEILVLCDNK